MGVPAGPRGAPGAAGAPRGRPAAGAAAQAGAPPGDGGPGGLMRDLLFSPIFFYGQIVLVLVLALGLGAASLGQSQRPRLPAAPTSWLRPILEGEEARA